MIIKKFIENEYPNFLDNIKATYSELINELSSMEYVQPKRYNQNNCTPEEYTVEVTFDKSMPLFSKCMDCYIIEYQSLPTQKQYEEYYYYLNHDFFVENNMLTDGFKKAISNRCFRAYPSLIRDIVFGKYLQEKLPSDYKVINNQTLDTKAEIDLLIIGKNGNWGVHLFTNTARSNMYRMCKNNRQQLDFNNVTHIDLPIDLSDCHTINNLKLYGDKQFEQLINICKNLK